MIITVLHSPVSFFYYIILSFLFFHALHLVGSDGATITIVNRCSFTVWPGILSNSGSGDIGTTGFELASGGSRSFQAPASWSGRVWARTGCNFDSDTGQGTCLTGDCGSNQVECNGAGAKPPATLAEFTIGSGPADPARKQDFYDVSLVDGYNVPMLVEANGGSEGTCLTTGCVTDLNQKCPTELRFGSGSACKSACEAFGSPEYCCSGAYASPTECKPSMYSEIFKSACPRSYSYAFDDATSTFTCTDADYTITLCPSLPSQKSAANGWREGGGLGESSPSPSPLSTWLSDVFTSDSSNVLQSSQYLLIFTIFLLLLFRKF
ncbi:PREDICTED: thaumatin-like protein 1b isoform X1 [Camelina sativa]|uniref:Thaumatin-like protein 1b isoform X1 n=1 Tax=Camelina sativa TaxID=90675 RepID=A0ABM0UZJ7_CAMSA|nr:PREDICTED: thaumatin-like protein 1b isoform X1 [Camelina sativa]